MANAIFHCLNIFDFSYMTDFPALKTMLASSHFNLAAPKFRKRNLNKYRNGPRTRKGMTMDTRRAMGHNVIRTFECKPSLVSVTCVRFSSCTQFRMHGAAHLQKVYFEFRSRFSKGTFGSVSLQIWRLVGQNIANYFRCF